MFIGRGGVQGVPQERYPLFIVCNIREQRARLQRLRSQQWGRVAAAAVEGDCGGTLVLRVLALLLRRRGRLRLRLLFRLLVWRLGRSEI